ncbi:Cellobiose dehydrogenase [Apiospora phragmitis]|uniref:Cellobiose dehydrogenase n=1 Tax=Apiospora phragmitis TaxID=2905665 RepID=A0ABR1TB67_9PEZI
MPRIPMLLLSSCLSTLQCPVVSGQATNGATASSEALYDYIVAGAGPAGIVVAQRFAETGASVLLLERGGPSTFATGGTETVPWNDTVTIYDIPAYSHQLNLIPAADGAWCSDIPGLAGCILGGGSVVNGLQWVKPATWDFDDFPAGWKWDDVAPAEARLYERNPGTSLPSADGRYYDQAAYQVLTKQLAPYGWREVDTLVEPDAKDMTYFHPADNVLGGLRAGPVRTYLPLAEAKENFKLQLNTKVIRAVRTNATITGVEVEDASGSRQIIRLAQGGKVILSAGAMSTPRLLFNSGIGTTEQLRMSRNGSISPVGKNIQDHPMFRLVWNVTDPALSNLTSLSTAQYLNPSAEDVALFAQGSGPLTQGNIRLNLWQKITNQDGGIRFIEAMNFVRANGTVLMGATLTRGADSRGELGIRPNGTTYFVRDPWLQTAGDREAVSTFFQLMLDYARGPESVLEYSRGGHGATVEDLWAGGFDSARHFVGSARLGTDDGRKAGGSAVVDVDARVYGTENLFVVDASVIPSLPTGNSMAITMVVAERAAESILALREKKKE